MNAETSISNPLDWQQQAYQYLIQGDYTTATNLYEQAIAAQPGEKCYYWYLGLMLLLQEQEIEAQTTWLLALAEGEPEQVELWTSELIQILQTEAQRRESLADYQVAWAIRQHIQEISPDNLDNLLNLIQLSLRLQTFTEEDPTLSLVVQILKSETSVKVDPDLLVQVLQQILDIHPLHANALEFTELCRSQLNSLVGYSEAVTKVIFDKTALFVKSLPSQMAAKFAELCFRIEPNNITILANLVNLYQDTGRYLESLEIARSFLNCSQRLEDQIAAHYLIVRGYMRSGGQWQEAYETYKNLQKLLKSLIEFNSIVNEDHFLRLMITVVFSAYFTDDPKTAHELRNQVAKFCQSGIQNYSTQGSGLFQSQQLPKRIDSYFRPLKIGYISTCLRRHSVGWLARWVFQYHERDKFQIYAYSLGRTNDNLQQFIADHASEFCDLSEAKEIIEIAERIYDDEIDVLIDLDSLTSAEVCGVMALQPAPVQVTWLGSDASGFPAIDYFIADPYVLPESAQDYYSATIWRLPKTYIAVDGFEVGVPTLRREQLNISNDAVVYLSCQTASKRHPNTARLQIKILKEVPDSYLLIKGQADQESIKSFFEQIAESEGVGSDRLRFLPDVDSEAIHRANLGIADVVLDTYPYNGATTTLETLWMCVPLVTRVGQQFAARNSYTMMMNVGVKEGIAWSDEEYVEWGVRLGKDPALRQQISWRLRQSRQTSPLWNAKQFTCEMEKAYEQMWQRYVEATQ